MSGARISSIAAGSPASTVDLVVDDELVSVNGREPTDIIEYQQLIDGDVVTLVVRRAGEALARKVTITKAEGQPLGLNIDSSVFDRIRTCDNHCTFCFIYQLPKGMRRSLYVKDDDFRLSFLYGNYTTLTRFTEFDLERIIDEGLSPLYVSIHTTNPTLRAEMLRNPRGATSLRWLRELLRAGIVVHGQVVVCPGVNDGAELERTLFDVLTLYPELASVALVPVGVSDLSVEATMRSHNEREAREVVELAERFQRLTREVLGVAKVFASDEFYLVAGLDPPGTESFESLDEAENGVGLVAAFAESFAEGTPMAKLGSGFFQSVDGAPAMGYRAPRTLEVAREEGEDVTVLTGEYAAPILRRLFDEHGFGDVEVKAVKNRYFGGNIHTSFPFNPQPGRNAAEFVLGCGPGENPPSLFGCTQVLPFRNTHDLMHPAVGSHAIDLAIKRPVRLELRRAITGHLGRGRAGHPTAHIDHSVSIGVHRWFQKHRSGSAAQVLAQGGEHEMAARLGQAAAEADGHGAVQFQLRDVAVVLLPLGHGHARHLDFAAAEFPGPAQGADAHEDHALIAGSPHHDFAQRRHQRERHQRHGTQQKGKAKQGLEQIKFVVRNLRAVKATHGTAGPD